MLMVYVIICLLGLVSGEDKTALIIVDVQNCFLPSGSLPVTDGGEIIPIINEIRKNYGSSLTLVVRTQDWHCDDHVSFASQHSGEDVYAVITLQYDNQGKLCSGDCVASHNVSQVLWPNHCIINTTDAEFAADLDIASTDVVVRKGYNCELDSYSAFYDNGGFTQTELDSVLKASGIKRVLVVGLAFDFCVYYTAKDAKTLGYETYFIRDAAKPVDESNVPTVVADLRSKGIHVISHNELSDVISGVCNFTHLTSRFSVVLLSIFSTLIRRL